MSIHVIARLTARPEHRDDVVRALDPLVAGSRAEPGNRQYDLFTAADGSPEFHIIETYVDAAALQAHRDSAHYRRYRATVADWLAAPPEVHVLEPLEVAGA
ncbi:MAG TPA: putative quinol monooxygenase [Dyella sp.]|nr:putative quinol monooxygenase [Dyella sp.]